MIKETILNNPLGLHRRYSIKKLVLVENPFFRKTDKPSHYIDNTKEYTLLEKPVDKDAEYFVMRLDTGGSDINHLKACRIGIHAYANAIEVTIPQLAKDLRERYPLL